MLKEYCQIFLPKNIPEAKISNPKYPSIIPVTWNPEYPLYDSYQICYITQIYERLCPIYGKPAGLG